MKFITSIFLIALLSISASLYLPWWVIAIAAFVVAVAIPQKPVKSFLSGFIALFLSWGALTWYLSNKNEHVLAHKVSMLILKTDNPIMLIVLTAFIGAVVAAFGALAGSFVRK
jgi:hypothetical protein